jgi:succinate dehydrogenase / fumarate reductase flavoprotein subunit
MTMEIREGRGVGPKKDHIHLHLDHLPPEILHKRLPGISESAKIFAGVDVTKEPIPVIPTVHYNMGGIPTNYHGEVLTKKGDNADTVVPGLMAVGEAACVSVHGANRLGSNSLIDLVVFGRASGLRAKELVQPNTPHKALPASNVQTHLDRLDKFRNASGGTPTAQLRLKMQMAMQEDAAVFRTTESLAQGVSRLSEVFKASSDIGINDRGMIWNTDLVEALEYDNLISQAVVTVNSASNRQESRGAHAHEDFPNRNDDEWMKHTLTWIDLASGKTNIDYRPVHTYTMTNDIAYIAPKARVY